MFGLSFSRFCGNTLTCPVCVGFFQANMPTETNHSSEIAASEYRANSFHRVLGVYKECVRVCSSNMISKCCYFIELMMARMILIILVYFL